MESRFPKLLTPRYADDSPLSFPIRSDKGTASASALAAVCCKAWLARTK